MASLISARCRLAEGIKLAFVPTDRQLQAKAAPSLRDLIGNEMTNQENLLNEP